MVLPSAILHYLHLRLSFRWWLLWLVDWNWDRDWDQDWCAFVLEVRSKPTSCASEVVPVGARAGGP